MMGPETYQEFPTYNALGRTALVFGVPLVPFAALVGSFLVLTMFLFTFIGGKALWVMTLPLPLVFLMKTISKTDDRALSVLGYEVYCFFYRRNARIFNQTNTILGIHYGKRLNDYQRFFEQCTQASSCPVRFSTKDLPTRHTHHFSL